MFGFKRGPVKLFEIFRFMKVSDKSSSYPSAANPVRGHRERLRKKYITAGIGGLHDYEAIELLLTYAIPLRDVKPLAKELLARFEDAAGIIDATHSELCEIKGISSNTAVLLTLVKDICSMYLENKMRDKDALSSPEAVRNFARMKLCGLRDEAFMVIYLNTKNHVNSYEIINEGTVDQAIVYPRNIIKKALATNASGLILTHNHPSGICEPSNDDIRITNAIKEAVKTLSIRLIDHVIVGRSGYFSFVEGGLL
jgi:DNA repair protein RadC